MVGSLGFVVPSHTQTGKGQKVPLFWRLHLWLAVLSFWFHLVKIQNPKSKLFFVTPKIQTCENGQRPEGTEEQNPKYL